jgi:hypothetical protein
MSPTITPEQRDALYDSILDRLSAIEDVWMAAERGDYDDADRLGREFSDSLMLVLSDLGWGAGTGRPVELTGPPEVLRRAFTRLREMAIGHSATVELAQADSRKLEQRDSLVIEACQAVLADLDEAEGGG